MSVHLNMLTTFQTYVVNFINDKIFIHILKIICEIVF